MLTASRSWTTTEDENNGRTDIRDRRKKPPPIHPGEILNEEFLVPMKITQYRLAQAIGVDPRRVHAIIHGERSDHG